MAKPSITELMKKAKEMQQKMQDSQKELEVQQVTGEAGGGMVKVTMNGRHDVTKVEISDEILKEDKEILEDLIVAATNDAVRKIEQMSQEKMSSITEALGLPPGTNPFA